MIMTLLAAAAVSTFLLTGGVLKLATHRGWLDIPNARSSHDEPTPRGGGIAIVACTILGLIVAWRAGWIGAAITVAIGGGGSLVAVVGWLDDRRSLSPLTRIGIHFLAAAWALYNLGGLDSELLFRIQIPRAALDMIALLVIVWATNLYNFMDGIDGIAAVEALTVGAFASILLFLRGADELAFVAALLAACSLGFLVWNWSPARIFMGDVGSGFLGFAFGCLAVAAEQHAPGSMFWIIVLAGVFVFDATVTLLRRALHREPIHAAHRSHAYQRITRAGFTHSRATSAVLLINLLLGALVLLGTRHPIVAPVVAAICLAVLTASYIAVEHRLPMYRPGRRTSPAN